MSRAEKDRSAGLDRWLEALSWRETLRDAKEEELTSAVGRNWQLWYADVENRRAFDSASRLLDDRASYRKRARPAKAELDADRYDLSVPITEWRLAHGSSSSRRQRWSAGMGGWLWAGGVAAALVVAAAMAFLLLPPQRWPGAESARAVVYETAVGRLREVQLQDGSSIVLGGRTRLSVAFSAQRRSVRLIEGEAWFKVAHDHQWPFVVTAGDGTITAVGTAFLVTRESDRVVVTVTDGTVEVSARPPAWPALRLVRRFSMRPIPPPVPVSRGEELAFGENGTLRPVKPADTRAATAWTHGRLTFDDQPLRYVVETVNRYSSRRVVVGPAAGALRFSGIVFDTDIEDWLKSLEVIFPVTESERGGSVYIQMRSPGRPTSP